MNVISRTNRKGAAMILVICIMAVILVFCLSLILSASVLLSNSQQAYAREQCRIWAVSLSEELGNEITQLSFASAVEESAADDGSLWFYLKDTVWNSWPYYNEEEIGHTATEAFRYFDLEDGSLPGGAIENLDDVEILMYWEGSSSAIVDNTPLFIQVTCRKNRQSCTITSEYLLISTLLMDTGGEIYDQWRWDLIWRE